MTGRPIDARLAELRPHPQNYNRHSEAQVKRLMQSLETFGQPKPIVIWRGTIIAGHGLVEAAKRLGWETLRAADTSEEWTEAQALAFVAADNELARLADPDEAALAALAASLRDVDAELAALAAGTEERLRELLATLEAPAGDDPGPQVDKAEELREKWGVEPGNIFICGEHRVACGDSTDKALIDRLLMGDKVDLLLNDPPYGMRLDADFSGMVNHLDFANEKGVKNGKKYHDVIGDHDDYNAAPVMAIFQDVKEQFWWGADYYSATLGDTMHQGAWLVWDKRLDESADKMYGSCFELLWSRQKHKRDILRHKWAGIFGTEHEPQRGRMHPNQKPVELYEDLLTRYSDAGAVVVDCYAGSGTTLIACERLGRRCRAVEIEPGYVAVALERWATMTGRTPVLVEPAAAAHDAPGDDEDGDGDEER